MAFGHSCTKTHYNQNAADKGVMSLKAYFGFRRFGNLPLGLVSE
jgi:hypothetical protein